MKPPYLIIDGYNLMHAAGIARSSYRPGDLERCRNQLARHLLSLLSNSVVPRTTVVYDAFESVSDDDRHYNDSGLKITFAPKGTDADAEIELQLLQHSSPRQVLVVSSDHRLHKAAQRRKARCIDSDEFLAEIGHGQDNVALKNFAGRPISPAVKQPKPASPTRQKSAKKVPAENLSLDKLAERLAADPELASLLNRLSQPVTLDSPPAVLKAPAVGNARAASDAPVVAKAKALPKGEVPPKATAGLNASSQAKAKAVSKNHAQRSNSQPSFGKAQQPESASEPTGNTDHRTIPTESPTDALVDAAIQHPFTSEYLNQLQQDVRQDKLK